MPARAPPRYLDTCSACHKSPRGLLKNTSASSLPGFLRQHYDRHRHGLGALVRTISTGPPTPGIRARIRKRTQAKTPSRKQGRISPTGSAAVSRPPHLRRAARPMPTRRDRKARARVRAAKRSGSHGTRGARCRQACRWAGPGAGRDRQQIGRQAKAGQTWQARRRGTAENRAGTPPRRREGRCVAGRRQAGTCQGRDLPGRSPPRLKPARSIPRRTDAPRTRATSRPARQRSPPAKSRSRPQGMPIPPRSMLPRRTPGASSIRSGLIRCRRSRRAPPSFRSDRG